MRLTLLLAPLAYGLEVGTLRGLEVGTLRPQHFAARTIRMGILDDIKLEAKQAASIAELPVMFADEDGDVDSFDFDIWATHRDSSRYGRLLIGTFFGSTTRRISPVVAALVLFSGAVDFYNNLATLGDPTAAGFGIPPAAAGFLPQLQLPITPFELTAPVLGLLLVFRTDTANERFNSGSEVAWEITASLRSAMRRIVAWTATDIVTDEERATADELLNACLLLHGWIMGSYLRGDWAGAPHRPMGEGDKAELLLAALGAGNEGGSDLESTSAHRGLTPNLAISAISVGCAQRLFSLSDQERIAIDDEMATVTCALAKCEKILRTPIPLGYTRYTVRVLWIWLTLLPFALVRTFSEFGLNTWWEDKPQPVVVLAMLFIGFIFLSIEDIAVQIEEPFAILPLHLHQRWLQRDADEMRQLMRWAASRRGGEEGAARRSA